MTGSADPVQGPGGEPRLDVVLALRRTVQALWANRASIVLAGLALITVPGLLSHWLIDDNAAAKADWDTLSITLRAALAMLYVALVSWGMVARLAGRALPTRDFVQEGLRRAQPGVQVALIAGAAVVLGLTLQLFARHGTAAGFALQTLLITAGLWGLCTLMPVVPAAVVERLGPMAAFRRAAALTAGNRDRILALALVVGLALAPSGALVAGIAGPDGAGPWLQAAFELAAWSLAGTVPAVVYAGLIRRDSSSGPEAA